MLAKAQHKMPFCKLATSCRVWESRIRPNVASAISISTYQNVCILRSTAQHDIIYAQSLINTVNAKMLASPN